MTKKPRPTKKDPFAEEKALLASLPKMSETIIRFAKPLLDVMPQPPTTSELHKAMIIVTVAWNLPLYERRQDPKAGSLRATWEQMLSTMPKEIRAVFETMASSRLNGFGDDPRSAVVDVVPGEHGEARIVATAALLDSPGKPER